MNPKIKRISRIMLELFSAILVIFFIAVCAVDELYEFVSDDFAVRSTLYAAGAEDMVFIKSGSEEVEGALKTPTKLVNTYKVVEHIAWYMEHDSEGSYNWLAEELTENDMLYIDRLADLRHAGHVAQLLVYAILACYILCIFGKLYIQELLHLSKAGNPHRSIIMSLLKLRPGNSIRQLCCLP